MAGDVRALCVGWSTLRVRVSRAVADRFGKNTSTHNSSQHEKETCTEHVCATQARAHHNTCLHGQGTEKKTKVETHMENWVATRSANQLDHAAQQLYGANVCGILTMNVVQIPFLFGNS